MSISTKTRNICEKIDAIWDECFAKRLNTELHSITHKDCCNLINIIKTNAIIDCIVSNKNYYFAYTSVTQIFENLVECETDYNDEDLVECKTDYNDEDRKNFSNKLRDVFQAKAHESDDLKSIYPDNTMESKKALSFHLYDSMVYKLEEETNYRIYTASPAFFNTVIRQWYDIKGIHDSSKHMRDFLKAASQNVNKYYKSDTQADCGYKFIYWYCIEKSFGIDLRIKIAEIVKRYDKQIKGSFSVFANNVPHDANVEELRLKYLINYLSSIPIVLGRDEFIKILYALFIREKDLSKVLKFVRTTLIEIINDFKCKINDVLDEIIMIDDDLANSYSDSQKQMNKKKKKPKLYDIGEKISKEEIAVFNKVYNKRKEMFVHIIIHYMKSTDLKTIPTFTYSKENDKHYDKIRRFFNSGRILYCDEKYTCINCHCYIRDIRTF